MCTETVEVVGLNDQRTAYEVEEFLLGVPNVDQVQADFLSDQIVIKYDESHIGHEQLMDRIEHAGCQPSERIDGIIDRIKTKLTHR